MIKLNYFWDYGPHVVHETTLSYFLASLGLGCLIHAWSALRVLLYKKIRTE